MPGMNSVGMQTMQRFARRTVTVQSATSVDDKEWNDFVRNAAQSSIYHLTEWRDIIRKLFGHETSYLCARSDTGQIIGVLPLVRICSRLFGNYVVSIPYFNYGGAIGDGVDVEIALMNKACRFADEAGASHIEFRDMAPREGNWPVRHDKLCMTLSLPDSTEALWRSFESKVRAQIKRPLRENVEVTVGQEKVVLLDEFYQVFSRNMRDLGTPVYSKQFFAEIIQVFPHNTFFVIVKHDGRPAAAAFLLGFRGRLEIPWASSIRKYNALGVNMLLYWEAMKAAIENGYQVLDFGRSTVDSGTFRFKKQWGAEPKQLYWHYWIKDGGRPPMLNPSNPKYQLAIKVWQKLPLCIANWLGPNIVRGLP
jgi:FemAB-related protein (PEP-CTERM system-associated)